MDLVFNGCDQILQKGPRHRSHRQPPPRRSVWHTACRPGNVDPGKGSAHRSRGVNPMNSATNIAAPPTRIVTARERPGAARARRRADRRVGAPALGLLGLQHVLVMYAGAVAVPLIIGRALKLPPEQVAFLISADLFACGLATLVQSLGLPGRRHPPAGDDGRHLRLGRADDRDGRRARDRAARHLRLGDRRRAVRVPRRAARQPAAAAVSAGRDRHDHPGDRHLADAGRRQLGRRRRRQPELRRAASILGHRRVRARA